MRSAIKVRAVLPACLYGEAEGARNRAKLVAIFERELKGTGITVEQRLDSGIVFRLEWLGVRAAGAGAFDAVNAVAAMAAGVENAVERIAKKNRGGAELVTELNRAVGRFRIEGLPKRSTR